MLVLATDFVVEMQRGGSCVRSPALEVFGAAESVELQSLCASPSEALRLETYLVQLRSTKIPQKIAVSMRGSTPGERVECIICGQVIDAVDRDLMLAFQITERRSIEVGSAALSAADAPIRVSAINGDMVDTIDEGSDDSDDSTNATRERQERPVVLEFSIAPLAPLVAGGDEDVPDDHMSARSRSVRSGRPAEDKVSAKYCASEASDKVSVRSRGILSRSGSGGARHVTQTQLEIEFERVTNTARLILDHKAVTDILAADVAVQSPWQSFEIQPTALTIGSLIGRGGYGNVHCGLYRNTPVAIKTFHPRALSGSFDRAIKLIKREIGILMGIRHPHVLLACGWMVDEASGAPMIRVVTELCLGGSVFHRLYERCDLDFFASFRIVQQVAQAMEFLHANQICHRDIKVANVLLTTDSLAEPHAKLGDFGFGRAIGGDITPGVGTKGYKAPEELDGHGAYEYPADVYSFGLLLFETVARTPPFSEAQIVALYRRMHSLPEATKVDFNALGAGSLDALRWGKREGCLPELSKLEDVVPAPLQPSAFREMVTYCCHKDADLRPVAADVCAKLRGLDGVFNVHSRDDLDSPISPST
jgi:serine/threonine protein kinase